MANTHSNPTTHHLIQRSLGLHKGSRRLWLEGKRLADVGFKSGVRYQLVPSADSLTLRLTAQGDHVVSHKQGRPVVDILTRALGDVDRVEIRFVDRAVLVSVHPIDRDTRKRLSRLNHRLASGQQLRLGSLCHGGGVASDALLRGLGRTARLEFAVEMDAQTAPEQALGYINQSLAHGPLSRGGMSVEGDLGDIDARDLPECDILEAGLPCISASKAGRSKKGLDQPEDDAATADLVVAFLDIVRATQPAVVLLENVPEYADSASAAIIRRRLERFGYVLHESVLHGSEWSLEARDRWVLLAVTAGLEVDLELLRGTRTQSALGEVLDRKVPASAWRTTEGKDRKEAADKAKGSRWQQRFLTAESTSVPTLRRGYQRNGSTDPRLRHPSRAGYSRLLSVAEHARIKGVPAQLVKGLSEKRGHEVLGQSVISPAFVALGGLIGQVVA